MSQQDQNPIAIEIEAVLFDFGGTLFEYGCLRPAMHDALAHLFDQVELAPVDASVSAAAYMAALRKSFSKHVGNDFYLMRDLFRDAALDTVGLLSALEQVSKATSDPLSGLDDSPSLIAQHADVQDCDPFLAVTADGFALRPGVIETLRALRSQGLRVGIVTNMDINELTHLISIAELESELDLILSSEEAGSCKPDSRIFIEAARRIGSTPCATMFVGDSIYQDIEGAKRAGLRPVYISRRTDDHAPDDQGSVPTVRAIPDLVELIGHQ
jgi:HAD superfamily hydrolase (TIGR01549 family)